MVGDDTTGRVIFRADWCLIYAYFFTYLQGLIRMKYTLIKGSFHVVGFSPDGDSMMFRAQNPLHWVNIGGDNRELFEEKLAVLGGAVQLRLQGIDALETHYSPESPTTPLDVKGKETSLQIKPVAGGYHQPDAIGRMARDYFMQAMGVKKAEWKSWGKNTWIERACFECDAKEVWVKDKLQDVLPGYIVTSEVEKNGRPLSWVFSGDTDIADGTDLTKSPLAAILKQSVNYQLLKEGLVYPYFFMTLAGCLRDILMAGTKLAQTSAARKRAAVEKKPLKTPEKVPNLWFYDRTDAGVKINDLKQVTDEMEIYPYLFRKLAKTWYRQQMQQYWEAVRAGKPFTFDPLDKRVSVERLLEDGNPYVFVISEQDFVKFNEIIELKGDTLRLRHLPLDLVFLS